MERIKKILEDVCVYAGCLISIVILFHNIFDWMLYV